ncbi:cell separation during budding [Mortierella sp. AD011]|nr:cell separation during budding [Mortierella sp. AD011]
MNSEEYLQHREGLTTSHHDWSMIQVGKLVEGQTVVKVIDPNSYKGLTLALSLPTCHSDANSSVEDACEVLLKHGISSAPVYDAQRNTYTGMFDYSDMMSYILLSLKKMDVPAEDQTIGMRELIERTNNSQNVPVKMVSVAVMDPTGNLIGILSQSFVLDYLANHLSEFPQLQPVMQQSVEQLGLSGSKVLSVNGEAQVLDALLLMSKHSVTSLAVLDEQGVLLGNISMTDIQHIMKDLRSSWLWLSCFKFISNIRRKRGVETGEDQYPVMDVNLRSTFGYTIAKLQATKVHRLWVANDSGLVEGVVSLTDVFKVLSSLLDS